MTFVSGPTAKFWMHGPCSLWGMRGASPFEAHFPDSPTSVESDTIIVRDGRSSDLSLCLGVIFLSFGALKNLPSNDSRGAHSRGSNASYILVVSERRVLADAPPIPVSWGYLNLLF